MDNKAILLEQIEALRKHQEKLIAPLEACEIAKTIKELIYAVQNKC